MSLAIVNPHVAKPSRTVEPVLFREAMSAIASQVFIVTSVGPTGREGMTATAVASVSDDPPSLLVCINRKSRTAAAIRKAGFVGINVLTAADQAIAEVFAGRTGVHGEDRFRQGHWRAGVSGAPLLMSAVMSLDCRVIEVLPVATHLTVIAEVTDVVRGSDGDALTYWHRSYRTLTR